VTSAVNKPGTRIYDCDLCGCADAVEVPHAREYTGNQPIHICSGCGFVYVRERRDPQAIADSWSNELYGKIYTARMPWVKARQIFVADFIDVEIGLKGKRLCDIGSGEGQFLQMVRDRPYEAEVFGIEPSAANCRLHAAAGIPCFEGTIESFMAAGQREPDFDIAAIMWTVENCNSCIELVSSAWKLLKPGGHVCIATGSRLLVPFKKPLQHYLGKNPADTHCFRFSANTLRGLLARCGFATTSINHYIANDILCVIGRKMPAGTAIAWEKDDPNEVADFFRRWHVETRDHYANA
jgi:SAM-dependent methyltransferase